MQDFSNFNEYGGNIKDNPAPTETILVAENFSYNSPRIEEFPDTTKKNKKSVMTKVLATVLALMVGVGVGASVLTPVNKAKVELLEFYSDATTVGYHLEVDSETELEVVLYNDFTHRSAKLENGANGGTFENLKSGVKYTLVVKGDNLLGEKELLRREIYTLKEDIY